MKTAAVKTNRGNGSFSIISLTECQEALSEGQFGKGKGKRVIITLSGADVCTQSVGIDPYTYWGVYRFFPGHFLRPEGFQPVGRAPSGGCQHPSRGARASINSETFPCGFMNTSSQIFSHPLGGNLTPDVSWQFELAGVSVILFESVRWFTVSRVRNPTTDWYVVISDTAITLNQVNWLYCYVSV